MGLFVSVVPWGVIGGFSVLAFPVIGGSRFFLQKVSERGGSRAVSYASTRFVGMHI